MLDHLEGVAAQLPPLLTHRRLGDDVEAGTALDAALGTAIVRVAHEHNLHLKQRRHKSSLSAECLVIISKVNES